MCKVDRCYVQNDQYQDQQCWPELHNVILLVFWRTQDTSEQWFSTSFVFILVKLEVICVYTLLGGQSVQLVRHLREQHRIWTRIIRSNVYTFKQIFVKKSKMFYIHTHFIVMTIIHISTFLYILRFIFIIYNLYSFILYFDYFWLERIR
jgi:hypothetical protein